MPDPVSRSLFLFSCFTEFYELVAEFKVAIREGRLPLMLRVGDQPSPTEPADIAAMVSGQLAGVLYRQLDRVSRERAPGTVRAHRVAVYAMAALADEIFVLELDWVGREAWLDLLLEYKLFHSRTAGCQMFSVIRRLLDQGVHSALHVDLAVVLLMALQLGFKGQYRGERGELELRALRAQLLAMLRKTDARTIVRLAFPQAYQNLVGTSAPSRLAPLTPWYVAAGVALGLYLVVSTVVWLRLIQPFLNLVAGA